MNLAQLLDKLKVSDQFIRHVTKWHVINSVDSKYAPFPESVNERLVQALNSKGIHKLYTHQAEAFEKVNQGKNVVVVTPTASGKTLCYNLPIFNAWMSNPNYRALYLFPTKALSQDQLGELKDMIDELGIDLKTYTFDGDTPQTARKAIRSAGHIVVTNPDMLHQGILPHHTKWIKLFENLKFVVIDEIHYYRGVFGSHLSNVIRRLKRICKFYGSDPIFICSSATIANPAEHTRKILEEDVELVDNNGAATGEKHFLFVNPPVVNFELGIRESVIKRVTKIASEFLANNIQTIVFARSRLMVEVMVTYLRDYMRKIKKPENLVRGYRGGYLPNQRREIEKGLKSGKILCVVSTNALELGIDIGQLEVSIVTGYPGTIASTWQQIGRAGRSQSTSAAIFVASSSPLDQFLINHPEYFLAKSPEQAIVDPNNLSILVNQIKCAAFEIPFSEGDQFGIDSFQEILNFLYEDRILHQSGGQYHWMSDVYPAVEVSLRSATVDNVVIIDKSKGAKVIGEVDFLSAPMLVHDEAIYIHEGQQYIVEKFDYEQKQAFVKDCDVDYYTDSQRETDVSVIDIFEGKQNKKETAGHYNGEVKLTTLVTSYKKIKFHTHENVGFGKVYLPPQEMHTTGYWLEIRQPVVDEIVKAHLDMGFGIKALGNVFRNIVPLYIMSDYRDILTVPMVRAPLTQLPTIYICDNYTGGVGFAQRIFDQRRILLEAAKDLIEGCGCKSGCPSCVGPAIEAGPEGKMTCLKLIELLMD